MGADPHCLAAKLTATGTDNGGRWRHYAVPNPRTFRHRWTATDGEGRGALVFNIVKADGLCDRRFDPCVDD
jgi:hypothetical protein